MLQLFGILQIQGVQLTLYWLGVTGQYVFPKNYTTHNSSYTKAYEQQRIECPQYVVGA